MTETNQLPPSEREAFEAFAQNCPMGKYSIARRGDGYDSSHTQLMWDAWQARAQVQGEPVLFIHPDTFAMNNAHVGAWKPGHELTGYIPLYTHPAPSVPKDHQIAALVNKVRDIARMFHDHQSLRERIAIELVPALKASQEVKSNAERVPEFSRIAKRKLDELQKQGFGITGYAIQRGTQRGFITNGGFVGWWRSDEAPRVPSDVVRDAERYRWRRDNGVLGFSGAPSWRVSVSFDAMDAYAQTLDSNIDAAMLAAKEGTNGEIN